MNIMELNIKNLNEAFLEWKQRNRIFGKGYEALLEEINRVSIIHYKDSGTIYKWLKGYNTSTFEETVRALSKIFDKDVEWLTMPNDFENVSKITSYSLNEDIADRLSKIANSMGLEVSGLISMIINHWLYDYIMKEES